MNRVSKSVFLFTTATLLSMLLIYGLNKEVEKRDSRLRLDIKGKENEESREPGPVPEEKEEQNENHEIKERENREETRKSTSGTEGSAIITSLSSNLRSHLHSFFSNFKVGLEQIVGRRKRSTSSATSSEYGSTTSGSGHKLRHSSKRMEQSSVDVDVVDFDNLLDTRKDYLPPPTHHDFPHLTKGGKEKGREKVTAEEKVLKEEGEGQEVKVAVKDLCYGTVEILSVVAITSLLNFGFVLLIWGFVRWAQDKDRDEDKVFLDSDLRENEAEERDGLGKMTKSKSCSMEELRFYR